ncbi:MAG: hypothetical protein JXB88_23505 [Spirochaetales bacterium]|nr:hypothetical protein [Spirochaetales bacterium]
MSDNRTVKAKNTNIFNGLGRFLKTIGDAFNKKEEDTDNGSSIPVDISPGIQEIPPVLNEHEDDFTGQEIEEDTSSGDSLRKILATLSAVEAKQKFVDFIRKNEADRLTSSEIETLDSACHRAMTIAKEKRENYASFTGTRDIDKLRTLLNKLKIDNNTPPFVKQEIVKDIIKELKGNTAEDKKEILSLINNYTVFLKRLDWEINGEKRIIDYTIKTLNKSNNTKDRLVQLNDLAPFMQARIKDKKIKDISQKLFDYMLDFYNQLNQRITGPDNNEEPEDRFDLDLDDNNLPDFGAEEDTFLKKLAQKDDPADMASEIDRYPEEEKADIIGEIAFDPRFDRYFKEIIGFLNKEDLGKLIGMVIMRVKEIERTQGRNISRAYITDLINRLTHKLGAEHIIVLKVKNIEHFQQKAYGESIARLEELKRKISGKSPYEQIQILKDTSEEPGCSAIFGAIRNLERITVETHFEEIFSGMPLETQKVVAEGLLSDLVALKKYYPHLISRLEMKLDEVTRKLEKSTYTPGENDHDLIDRIVDYANKSESGGSARKEKKDRVPEEIMALEKEIDSLPSLNEKITTVRFWIENNYYSDKPPVDSFLKNKLEDLEQAKAREGGLLRDLFDELRELDTIKEKINFLEDKLKDPLYFHLKSMIKTLIGNIASNTNFAPVKITEEWILNQLKGIPDVNRKIDWLRIRRYLVPFEKFSDFINDTIERFETYQQEELQEELEEKIFGNMLLEKDKGKNKAIYKNIIALTRAALSIEEKIKRRKLIKEQEILYPLDEHDRFYKQRKLLYYLLNTQNDDIPALKLKVLADKVLLSFDEKKDYFSLLKLSRFKVDDKVITLADELGITDEDIAYYAVYILGCNKPGLEQRIRFIEDFRSGLVDVDGVICPSKENRMVQRDYRDFFHITPPLIVKVLMDLKKKLPEKKRRPDSERSVPEDKEQKEENNENSIIEEEDVDSGDTAGISDTIEEKINKNSELKDTDSISIQPETEAEETAEEKSESSLYKESEATSEKKRQIHKNGNKKKFKTSFVDDSSQDTIPSDSRVHTPSRGEENEEENAYDVNTVYEKNKSDIDNLVQKRLRERGMEKSKSLVQTMRVNSENATKKEEIPLSKRIARLLFDLSRCFPEAVPDIINHTIIPVFVESKSDTGRDVFNAINQNIFFPVLYNGAEVDVDSTIDSIESFLGKKGILSESHKIIHGITDELRKVRSKEIKSEVERKIHGLEETSLPAGKEPDDIVQVLRYLAGIDNPNRIIHDLDEKYIIPLSGSTQQNDLSKKLHTLKSILVTSKSINWQKVGDYYGPGAITLIKQIKQRIGILISVDHMDNRQTREEVLVEKNRTDNVHLDDNTGSSDSVKMDKIEKKESASGEKLIVPEVIENVLIETPVFTDPHALILKIASKDPGLDNMFGKNRDVARQYVIDTLYNAGKIFTYDKKRYIGFGKLAHYLYDKKNKDYNRQTLTQAVFSFLSRFPGNAQKAAFVGVEEKDLPGFLHMLGAWTSPVHTPLKKTTQKGTDNKDRPIQQKHQEKTKQTVIQKNQSTTKKTIQLQTAPHTRDKRITTRREKEKKTTDRHISDKSKTQKKRIEQKRSISRKLSARGETMLKNAAKLITDKLILLIKLYNSRESLKMLYDSYLSTSSDRKYRLNLIDQKKHAAIYNAIKDDDAVLERLRFDVDKVMKQYHKKMSKMKK